MPVIDLLRHGSTERHRGRTDAVLSAEGWRQFQRQTQAGAWLRIVSFPARRARKAAARLASARGLELPPPNGERWSTLSSRVERALARLAEHPADSPILVATHAGPMRAALALAWGFAISELWALRIEDATRIRVGFGGDAAGALWREITELVQS